MGAEVNLPPRSPATGAVVGAGTTAAGAVVATGATAPPAAAGAAVAPGATGMGGVVGAAWKRKVNRGRV